MRRTSSRYLYGAQPWVVAVHGRCRSLRPRSLRSIRYLLIAAVLTSFQAIMGFGSTAAVADEPAKKVDFLFVQSAEGMTYQDGKLTLDRVNPSTIFFSDRPERIAGHMETKDFVRFWAEGDVADNFKSDPPNATISVLGETEVTNAVVELSAPSLEGGKLAYTVNILEGKLPTKADQLSVFIDVIGMPWTPMSYAGVARRTWSRAVVYPRY